MNKGISSPILIITKTCSTFMIYLKAFSAGERVSFSRRLVVMEAILLLERKNIGNLNFFARFPKKNFKPSLGFIISVRKGIVFVKLRSVKTQFYKSYERK